MFTEVLSLILTSAYIFCLILMTAIIVLENKPAQSTAAWLLAIYFVPFLGLVLYALAGFNWKRKKLVKQLPEDIFKRHLQDVIERQQAFVQDLHESDHDNDYQKAIHLLLKNNSSVVTLKNKCRIFNQGIELFSTLIEDLKQAKQYIHLEYFIWKSDPLGQVVKDILMQKAREGVEVRIILDPIGCFGKINPIYKEKLKKSGVDIRYFRRPLSIITGVFANYLNHRKIVVIDGEIGYTGGMNMGQEYIDGGKHFSHWRDTHLKLMGEAVQLLQSIFITDWFNSGGKALDQKSYFTIPSEFSKKELIEKKDLPIQIACSGPDSNWPSIKQLYFNMLINANKCVYIQSPYFIPDQSMLEALSIAALAGVDIHLMIAGEPDKRIPYWVAETYFETLLNAGVNIYRYRGGFLHSKVIMVDERFVSIGTCNMDIRSFQLDYEVNAVIYDQSAAVEVKEQFFIDLKECQTITLDLIGQKRISLRLRNSILKLLAPLL